MMKLLADKKSRYLLLVLLLLLGIALLVLGKDGDSDTYEHDDGISLATEYKAELERTAASMCSSLYGVESANVNITFDGTMSYVYAKNSEGSYGGTYFSSGGEPLFLKYEYPKIVGCAVICSGSDIGESKLELTQMLSAYLGIPSNKIYVGYKN